jgi:hypothetical protein
VRVTIVVTEFSVRPYKYVVFQAYLVPDLYASLDGYVQFTADASHPVAPREAYRFKSKRGMLGSDSPTGKAGRLERYWR